MQDVAPLTITGSDLTDGILYCVSEIEVELDVRVVLIVRWMLDVKRYLM